MKATEGVARGGGMIEAGHLKVAKITVHASVVDVTRHAFGDAAVHALSRRNPSRDRLVAAETPHGGHLPSGLVALLALGAPLERGVRPGKRAW
ncbi:MAG: hypothetical protein ABL971_10020 [Vicinamibacterales bacterium]